MRRTALVALVVVLGLTLIGTPGAAAPGAESEVDADTMGTEPSVGGNVRDAEPGAITNALGARPGDAASAQGPPHPRGAGEDAHWERLDRAYFAWDAGDYPAALETWIEVLGSPGGEEHVEEIALLTGELYRVVEVAEDGRNIRLSPDGRYAAYETTEDGTTITHVASLGDDVRELLAVQGTDLTFSPGSNRAAWLLIDDTDELQQLRQEVDELREQRDFEALGPVQQRLRWVEARNTRIAGVDLDTGTQARLDAGDLIVASLTFSADGESVYLVGAPEGVADRSDVYALPWPGAAASPSSRAAIRAPASTAVPAAAGGATGGTASPAGRQTRTASPVDARPTGPLPLTDRPGYKAAPRPVPGGEYLLYTVATSNPVPQPPAEDRGGAGARGGRGGGRGRGAFGGRGAAGADDEPPRLGLVHLPTGASRIYEGDDPVVSAGGNAVAYFRPHEDGTAIEVVELGPFAEPRRLWSIGDRVDSLAISPDGGTVAFQWMQRDDWEIWLMATGIGARPAATSDDNDADEGRPGEPVRLTREIQHDLYPTFLSNDHLLAVIGEGRHRRSYLYDARTLSRRRLFHNNTVRTIAPEYEWRPSADGTRVLIVSERDGDTVSPERAVFAVDLIEKVSKQELLARLEWNLAAESDLRARGEAMFAPIAEAVRRQTEQVSIGRIYRYQKDLFDFDSKNITQPGNAMARQYLLETYRSFGYEPLDDATAAPRRVELQWFDTEPRGGGGPIRTANVLATLRGTRDPDLVYVVSSHFDSTSRGPGADDDTSGTVALLEAARVLADQPLPRTVVFASFTGEESGLLGSREFVRQAEESGMRVVGALNNDMIGWANDHRTDNTIRYSNRGIRDLQHAAAFLFSGLITYDALYYRSTDAAAYYEAWGDIVGGIGSYPVLGNPHYHQPHDWLETINHEQVTETSRATVASIMLLASSPSRLGGLEVAERSGSSAMLQWTPSPESDVVEYLVRIERPGAAEQRTALHRAALGPGAPTFPERPGAAAQELRVDEPRVTIADAPPGTRVFVKAINDRGLAGWDWARVTIE